MTHYQSTHYPCIVEEYQPSIVDGELILFSAKTQREFHLNESSKLVWGLCNGESTVDEIIDLLADAYPEARDKISPDVHNVLNSLYQDGAIYFRESRPKKIAILVIAATTRPIYVHYIDTYWSKLIEYTNSNKSNIDIYLLFDSREDARGFEHLIDNIIIDRNTEFNGFYDRDSSGHVPGRIPGILSKTVYAYELLQERYDVFFRTNLSSMIHTDRFEKLVESKDTVIYSGGSVWANSLRANLVSYGLVGSGQAIKSLEELDSYASDTFVSGAAFFLGVAEVKHLMTNKKDIRYDIIDDVSIGLLMPDFEVLPKFTLILKREQDVEEMLDKLSARNYSHVRLQQFSVEKAQQLWQELNRLKYWV
jgi:hypothetical protein